jgi:2-hydroxy-3-oxopropionate reductase
MTKNGLQVGFIGLGIMGAPMALNLLKAGHALFVASRGKIPAVFAEQGATVCNNATEVAKRADIVITMVPDTPHVDDVLFGETGVVRGLSPGKLVIDMSSISPMATKAFAQRINALGCDYLDAPVSGGEVGAKAASLTIMVGGPQAAFDRAQPLFSAPARVRQALMGGFAASRILEVHGERMVKRTFNPGFRIELHQKDLNLALQGAKELGVSLPHTASAAQLMQSCAAHGMAGLDHSALCRSLELMANHPIAADPAA